MLELTGNYFICNISQTTLVDSLFDSTITATIASQATTALIISTTQSQLSSGLSPSQLSQNEIQRISFIYTGPLALQSPNILYSNNKEHRAKKRRF